MLRRNLLGVLLLLHRGRSYDDVLLMQRQGRSTLLMILLCNGHAR